ncbi:MAG: MurT ligase domain-containing protein [Patescibacteria group bacterium]
MLSTTSYLIAVWLGKLVNWFAVNFNLGAGGTWPGHLALKTCPGVLRRLEVQLQLGSILISGTNGKTTTASLIENILSESGLTVVANPSGANLINGLVSAFITDATFWGRPISQIGVFEVDEGNLPFALSSFTPELLILLNLSRDQLDRYGEIDSTIAKWLKAILKLPRTTKIILKKDDPYLSRLAESLSAAGFIVRLFSKEEPGDFTSPLSGDFNRLNTNAAVLGSRQLGITDLIIRRGLKNFQPAFGRGEEVKLVSGKSIIILLAKNPESQNENLIFLRSLLPQSLSAVATYPALLFVLNDNIPDGRDVSWIYDIDFEKHRDWLFRCPLFISGTRERDLTLRLKYAGIPVPDSTHRCSSNLRDILAEAIASLRPNQKLFILPTYSAMLQARKILTGKGIE